MKNIYLLKDLSRITGYSIYTLKYYLKLGIISEIGRSPDTQYRFFDDTTISALNKIRGLRLKHVPLKEIKTLMSWEAST